MPHAENSVTIARPPADVFAFLADAENDLKWRPGVLDMTRVSGEGVGTRYRQGVKGPMGRRVSADIEITEHRPPEVIGFRALEGPVHPEGRYEISPANGGSRVHFSLAVETTGLKRLIGPMVQKSMDREVAALDNLKRVLEAPRGS
jgi:carbon monoxide dehydrogenase subunit G